MDDYKKGILVAMQHRLQEKVKSGYLTYGLCRIFRDIMKQDGVDETCYLSFNDTFRSELSNARPDYSLRKIYWWPVSDSKVRMEFLQTLLDNN